MESGVAAARRVQHAAQRLLCSASFASQIRRARPDDGRAPHSGCVSHWTPGSARAGSAEAAGAGAREEAPWQGIGADGPAHRLPPRGDVQAGCELLPQTGCAPTARRGRGTASRRPFPARDSNRCLQQEGEPGRQARQSRGGGRQLRGRNDMTFGDGMIRQLGRVLPALFVIAFSCAGVVALAERDDGAILAKQVSAPLPLDPDDASWQTAPATTVHVYPQNTIRVPGETAEAGTVTARALYSAEELALRLEWSDASVEKARGVGTFADAASVQWPVQYGPGVRSPYIGMGNPGEPVTLWLWRADGTAETLAAEGFGTLTAQASDGIQVKGAWKDGRWRVVFRRNLAAAGEYCVRVDSAKQGLVPVVSLRRNRSEEH